MVLKTYFSGLWDTGISDAIFSMIDDLEARAKGQLQHFHKIYRLWYPIACFNMSKL